MHFERIGLAALLLLGIATVLLFNPSPAAAQSTCLATVSCGEYSQWDGSCYPALPPEAFNCSGWDFSQYCQVLTYRCPPPAGPPENPRCGGGDCSGGSSGGSGASPGGPIAAATKPINLSTGDTYIDQTDIRIPGVGGGLTFTRSWNSLWPTTQAEYQVGLFGPKWRSNYEERIFLGTDGYIKYSRSDGDFWSFGYNGSNWLPAAPANAPAILTQNSTNWIIIYKSGEKRLFDLNVGFLQAIIDRNGNTTTLSYDGLNRLTTVTSPASQHLTFTYANNTSYLVTGLSSDVGLSLSYSYDAQGRLLQVTKPDMSTLHFQYDGNSNITAVTDSQSKILEAHTYDTCNRGLSGSRANGVDAVTVTYAQPCQ